MKKNFIFLHKWLGLFTGIIIFVVAITGAIFCFQDEIKDSIFEYRKVEIEQSSFKKPSEIISIIQKENPNHQVLRVMYMAKNRSTVAMTMDDKKESYFVYLNPYSGKILHQENMKSDFFLVIQYIHMNLLLGDIGKNIIGYSTIIFILILLILAAGEIYRETHTFRVRKYKVKTKKNIGIQNCVKVIFLSDLHNCVYGNKNDKLYKAIQAEMPDMILIGGDMLVAKEGSSVQEALEFVKKLPHICQVYYTNGNHEQRMKENTDIYGDTYERYKAKLENCGVCFLENKAENIEKNGMKFSIYGLELDSSVNRKFKKADVTEKTVEEKIGKKGKDYSILMAHNPAYMDAYKKWGADLILSGHLHGGLVRCPGIGAVVTPQGFLFPKYSGEMRREGEQTIVVSRGLGSHTINIRLFNMPEVIAIEVCVR